MPGWVWVLIAVAAVLVVALLIRQAMARQRTSRLKGQFGPEYDRTVETADSKRKAEAELAAREDRREQLTIRPLSPTTRARFLQSWRDVQAQFVDDPSTAVTSADSLIQSVMLERGYPVEDFEQRAADVSVDHPHVVENYREGHRLAERSKETSRGQGGDNATEDLRQAMRLYRALFDELLDGDADEPRVANDSRTPTATGSREVSP
jgi:hypothetical protein